MEVVLHHEVLKVANASQTFFLKIHAHLSICPFKYQILLSLNTENNADRKRLP